MSVTSVDIQSVISTSLPFWTDLFVSIKIIFFNALNNTSYVICERIRYILRRPSSNGSTAVPTERFSSASVGRLNTRRRSSCKTSSHWNGRIPRSCVRLETIYYTAAATNSSPSTRRGCRLALRTSRAQPAFFGGIKTYPSSRRILM